MSMIASGAIVQKDFGAMNNDNPNSVNDLTQAMMTKLEGTAKEMNHHLRSIKYQENQKRNLNFDLCELVQDHLGDDFIPGDIDGSCLCEGSLNSALTLSCNFDNICDASNNLCAEFTANFTLAGVFEEDWTFGDDPGFSVDACAHIQLPFLEELCIGFDFAQPDFIVPDACSITYGGRDCICHIDDIVSCFTFDCSNEAPAQIAKFLVADSCQKVKLGKDASVKMFVPSIKTIPEDFVFVPDKDDVISIEADKDESNEKEVEEGTIKVDLDLDEKDEAELETTDTASNNQGGAGKTTEEALDWGDGGDNNGNQRADLVPIEGSKGKSSSYRPPVATFISIILAGPSLLIIA